MNDTASEKENSQVAILEYIAINHPEYTAPQAIVSAEFIKIVRRAVNQSLKEDDPGRSFDDLEECSDEEAETILADLPEKAIARPFAEETIEIIQGIEGALAYKRYVRDIADDQCVSACDFNNRANARSELGRYEEALEDYGRASELDPVDSCCLVNRMQLLVQLGRLNEAVVDAEHAWKIMEAGRPDRQLDLLVIANIFNKCNRPHQAAVCLYHYFELLESLRPYMRKDDDGKLVIDKNDGPIQLSETVHVDYICDLLASIDEKGRSDGYDHFNGLIEEMKRMAAQLKVLQGDTRVIS
jgi:tetratricopeptide (TPR) repeat protein